MSEQGNEFELDVEGHKAALNDDIESDVEGHKAADKAGLLDDKAGLLEDDVEGHVQPPRDADLGGTER